MEGLKRDACRVMNAPCSFGRVCSVDVNFCPRYTSVTKNQSTKLSVINHPSLKQPALLECALVTPHSSSTFGTCATEMQIRVTGSDRD